jgi:hypothetical protein
MFRIVTKYQLPNGSVKTYCSLVEKLAEVQSRRRWASNRFNCIEISIADDTRMAVYSQDLTVKVWTRTEVVDKKAIKAFHTDYTVTVSKRQVFATSEDFPF